jgi:hypothetical protein
MDEMEGVAADSGAGSPPAFDSSASPTSAATQNTDPDAQVPFHQHPRFQQLIAQNREFRAGQAQTAAHIRQLTDRLARYESSQRAPVEPPTQEVLEAARTLKTLMQADPELRAILQAQEQLRVLPQVYQGYQQLHQAHQRGIVSNGTAQLATLAKEAGLSTDPRALRHVEEMVAGVIRSDPDLDARFRAGDGSVIAEAFNEVNASFLTGLRRQQHAALSTTKQRMQRLPTPLRGGGARGAELPDRPEPGQERQFEQRLHQKAMQRLAELMPG